MSERLPRVVTKALAIAVGIASLAACSEGRETGTVGRCTKDSKSDIQAEVGAGNENDPQVLLDFIEEKGGNDYLDKERKGWVAQDRINGIGEAICRVASDDDTTKEVYLLKDILGAREDYLSQVDKVFEDLDVSTTTTES